MPGGQIRHTNRHSRKREEGVQKLALPVNELAVIEVQVYIPKK
jgi:hypothetical protein